MKLLNSKHPSLHSGWESVASTKTFPYFPPVQYDEASPSPTAIFNNKVLTLPKSYKNLTCSLLINFSNFIQNPVQQNLELVWKREPVNKVDSIQSIKIKTLVAGNEGRG